MNNILKTATKNNFPTLKKSGTLPIKSIPVTLIFFLFPKNLSNII